MLTELRSLVGDSTATTTIDPHKLGRAAGVLDLALRHGIWRPNQIEVSIGDFIKHGEHHETSRCSLLEFIADNEDSPDIIKQLFRAGLRTAVFVGVCAGSAVTLEMREVVLVGGSTAKCYCGNIKDFGDCTTEGYPRNKATRTKFCQLCGRFFDPHGQVLGFVERCTVASVSIACKCGRLVRKAPKPWAGDRSAVQCEHCGRKIHIHSGFVLGKRKAKEGLV